MQLSILKLSRIFFLVIFFFLPPSLVIAEEANLFSAFNSFKSGDISSSDFSNVLFNSVEQDSKALEQFNEYKSTLDGEQLESFADASSTKLLQRIKKEISRGNSDVVSRFNTLSDLIIPRDWVEERKQIQVLVDTFTSLEKVRESRDFDSLLKLDFSKLDKPERKLFEQRSLKLVEQFVEQAYDNPSSFNGFADLSKIASAWPTAGAVNKAQSLLDSMVDDPKLDLSGWTLDAPDVQSLVGELIANDEANRIHFLKLYEQKIEHSVKNKSFKTANIYLNWILGNRPDPNPKNIELRKKLVFLDPESSFAKKQMEKLVGLDSFSFAEKLKSGYFGSLIPKVIALTLFVILALLGLFILKPKFKGKGRGKKPHYSNKVDSEDEYTKLLSIFGLDENASETQIKRAFRSTVKEHHPDTHGAGGVVTDDEGNVDETFQNLKESYDRILEIRSSWFGS